jgi:hypothetical protein
MQSRIERRIDGLSPASAVSTSGRYSILPSRVRESSGKRCDVVSFPLSDRRTVYVAAAGRVLDNLLTPSPLQRVTLQVKILLCR